VEKVSGTNGTRLSESSRQKTKGLRQESPDFFVVKCNIKIR
jgi:hypothetical protein